MTAAGGTEMDQTENERRETPRRASDWDAKELETLRAQLELAKQDLERMEQINILAVVASSVVHDIRNSLGVISSTSQFVLNRLNPSEKEREAWKLVDRNVETIKNILKAYLGLARRAENVKQPTSLNDLASHVCNFVDSQARKNNIKILKQLDPSIPLLPLDSSGMESTILNLAINAMEAMGDGGTIIFRTRKDEQKEKFIVEIEDNGHGIQPELIQKIFTPFFTTKKDGTGMGLYSSKASVEQNGGALYCESEIGKGTKMILSFPTHLPQTVPSKP